MITLFCAPLFRLSCLSCLSNGNKYVIKNLLKSRILPVCKDKFSIAWKVLTSETFKFIKLFLEVDFFFCFFLSVQFFGLSTKRAFNLKEIVSVSSIFFGPRLPDQTRY